MLDHILIFVQRCDRIYDYCSHVNAFRLALIRQCFLFCSFLLITPMRARLTSFCISVFITLPFECFTDISCMAFHLWYFNIHQLKEKKGDVERLSQPLKKNAQTFQDKENFQSMSLPWPCQLRHDVAWKIRNGY